MSSNIQQLRDFSSLFSRSEVKRWFKNDFSAIDIKLKHYQLHEKYKGKSYLNLLQKTYKRLEKHYPNEYVLKNEFLKNWLKTELGTSNSIIFNEFKMGKAIADLAMFNGISKVFEIKTILDNKERLNHQISIYKKIFNEVYIVVPKLQIANYIGFDQEVGIISFEANSHHFELERIAKRYISIDIDLLMEILYSAEYIAIVKDYFGVLPVMNSFNQFEICKNLIAKIPILNLNAIFLSIMKKRKIHNSFFKQHASEFNQISLALNLKAKEGQDLIQKLKTNFIS